MELDTTKFKNTFKALDKFGKALISQYKNNLSNLDITSGALVDSLSYNVSVEGQDFIVNINLEHYWKWVGNGRGPGKFPPIESLEKWITAKHITPQPMTLKSGKTVIPTMKSLAFLIARSIAKYGTQDYQLGGRNSFELSLEQVKEIYTPIITEAITKDIKKLMKL